MCKSVSIVLLCSIAVVAFATLALMPPPEPETEIWFDDFDGTTLDTSRWVRIERGPSDWNNYMSPEERLCEVRDGYVRLWGVVNPDRTRDTVPYITGGITTKGKVGFNNGLMEVRARMSSAQGYWPALWMLPTQRNAWPDGGEIDIMEHLNRDSIVYQTIHTPYTLAGNQSNPKHSRTAHHALEDWNTYAVDMYADSLVFYVNGRRTHFYPRVDSLSTTQFPFSERNFYLLLDSQIEGSWVGKANPDQYPACMDIDFVRFTPHSR